MKRGKEIKLELFKNFKIVAGTVDNKNPKSIYLNLSAWGEPSTDDEFNYDRIIKNMHKTIKQTMHDYIKPDNFIVERTIVDLDMRESGVKYGKRSYVNCEITLYQKNDYPVNSKTLRPILIDLACMIANRGFEDNKYFNFYRTKTNF